MIIFDSQITGFLNDRRNFTVNFWNLKKYEIKILSFGLKGKNKIYHCCHEKISYVSNYASLLYCMNGSIEGRRID